MSTFGHFTVARTSVKYVLNASGVLASVAADTPAFEFNADGTYRGLLVEPAGTNLVTYSADFTQVVWVKTISASVTGNTGVAPDGTTTADTLTAGANGSQIQFVHTGTAGIAYNASFYIRRVTGTGVVNIRAVENTNIPITVTASWTRVSLSAVSTTTTIRIGLTLATSGDEVEIWGAQLETGSVATSYIPTVASTETRTADSVSLTGASSLIGQTEGTLYVEAIFTNVAGSSFARVLECFTGADDRISIVINASTARGFLTTAGVDTQGGTMSESVTNNTIYRIALAYAVGASQGAFYVNGTGDITSPTAIPATASINIGQSIVGGVVPQWIRAAALYPTRLSNAQLQALTT
jgi:hypothetical protein